MPDITLDIPSNTKFHSSLNEIDIAMKSILIEQMRVADPRDKSKLQRNLANPEKNNWLWDKTRVFQVDEMTTEEIFDVYLLRKNINGEKNTDVSYPLLAYMQEDIDTVFWGTGNRDRQWYFEIPHKSEDWEIGDTVIIATMNSRYRGITGTIARIKDENDQRYCAIEINGRIVTKQPFDYINDNTIVWFPVSELRIAGEKTAKTFKGKAITCKYNAVVLCDNKDELQYIRDKLMLRVWDAKIWWKYKSPTIDNYENQIFTVFGIPNINRYPVSKDKLKGEGFIYGASFIIDTWACITDEPIPGSLIENIRMNIKVENEGRENRIVIN